MSTFSEIGAAESKGTLAEAKAIGKQIGFVHRALAAVTLDALIIYQGLNKELIRQRMVEVGIIVVRIPVQTGFAVMTTNARPVTEGDRIEFPLNSGRYFRVNQEEDIKQDANGYDFIVKAVEQKTLTWGVQS